MASDEVAPEAASRPDATDESSPAASAGPKAGRRVMGETARRFATAAVLVPLVTWMIVEGGLVYLATVLAFTLLGTREFYHLIQEKGAKPLWSLGIGASCALPVIAFIGNEHHVTLLLTASLLGMMIAQLRKAQISESLASISGTFFGVVYVGWLLSHIIVLRRFYEAAVSQYGSEAIWYLGLDPQAGIFYVFLCLAIVVNCDAGAYFAGRAYGNHKLAPAISPGKSVEGAVGGVLWGTIVALITKGVFDYFWPALSAAFPWWAAAVFGVVISVVGMLGDLVESLLKRDADIKDTGALLPGMGGILDRIDAPLLAVPVMYYGLRALLYLQVG